ncbi:hypothetical protein [Agarilytica rhodophyticola]|uniref:hypothetical protein n=1 Tax=Agarilytica rhodophyticola TaxID=1737490 RepID=UPI000B345772|nr:hypothetical protein [Agarilytica rhodophyticola]
MAMNKTHNGSFIIRGADTPPSTRVGRLYRDKIYSSNSENKHILTTTDRSLATKMMGVGATIVNTSDPDHDESLHYNNDPSPDHYHLRFTSAKKMLSAVKSLS